MKKLTVLRKTCLLLFIGIIITSCSSDDGGSTSNYLKNVPKGEIVSVGERFFALTGFDEDAGKGLETSNSQKWWKYIYGEMEYKCDGEDETEEVESEATYFAFSPDGTIYYKFELGGMTYAHHQWEWVDNSKSKVRITNEYNQTLVFEFTELNHDAVVYASYQAEEGCSLLTWEQFGNPTYE